MHVDFSRHKRTTLRFCLINTHTHSFDHLYYSHSLSHIWCNSFVLCLIFVFVLFLAIWVLTVFHLNFSIFAFFQRVFITRVLCGLDSIIVQFCALNVLDEFPRSTFPKCISCQGSIGYLMLSLLSLQLWLVFSFILFSFSLNELLPIKFRYFWLCSALSFVYVQIANTRLFPEISSWNSEKRKKIQIMIILNLFSEMNEYNKK